MAAHNYPRPQYRQLTDGERDMMAEHRADQEYYCEDCLTRHVFIEYSGDDTHEQCEEYYYLLADREYRQGL